MKIIDGPDREECREREDYQNQRRYLGKLATLDVNGMSVFVKVVSMGKRSGHLILTVEPVSGYGTLRVDPNRVMMLSEEDLRRHELAEKTLRRDVECADTLSILGSLGPSGFVDRTAKAIKEGRGELWTKALPAMQELGAAKSLKP